jgi:redox-sensitive bicupin YhaK (pirin superfamily)
MSEPRYQDIAPERVPEAAPSPGVRVRVLAGACAGVMGPVSGVSTQPLYVDVRLAAGSDFALELTPSHTAFAYVYEGAARLGAGAVLVPAGSLAVLGPGATASAAAPDGPGRLLLVAARPLGEPVARYGPFVMNTREEILQAVRDYQQGRLG